ncbi:MAG: acetyl-CoA acetyltransferase [bacterium]|nr:acetyl-CoA acetyltransferase [bacterium]
MRKNTPVIIGAAQYSQSRESESPPDPAGLMLEACRQAMADSGAASLSDYIDTVYVTNINGWSYRDVPALLSEKLGLKPKEKYYSTIGGNTPQMFVNMAAKAITLGSASAVLMTGGESGYSFRRSQKGDIALNWPRSEKPAYLNGDKRPGSNDRENVYGLQSPVVPYALFETALRKESGMSIGEHKEYVGDLFERFSRKASENPLAWQKKEYTAEEITTPGPGNRFISYPYTLRMIANNQVDLSAALIITSTAVADKLGIAPEKRVYPIGGADLNNIFHVSQRPRLYDSPAIARAAELSLEQAGLTLAEIDSFDLYSCFPGMVQMAMNELGLSIEDSRDMTVTGGLPYFGAAFNNYSMHPIVAMTRDIRQNRSLKRLVLANGWFNTKESMGIYGGEPPARPWGERSDLPVQQEIDAHALPALTVEAEGSLTIEAYTMTYNRSGVPEKGIVIGRLKDGNRALAFIRASSNELKLLEETELVGETKKIRFLRDKGYNVMEL